MATIDDVFKVCNTIQNDIATINQRCKDCQQKIEGHQKTLYGQDGTKGIVARINALNGASKDKREWIMRIASPVISGLIVAAIIAMLYLWKSHNGK